MRNQPRNFTNRLHPEFVKVKVSGRHGNAEIDRGLPVKALIINVRLHTIHPYLVLSVIGPTSVESPCERIMGL